MNKYVGYVKTFKKYNYLLSLLVKSNIEKKYKGSSLGVIWSLLSPLLQMIVLTIIFSALFSKDIENFPLYLILGRLMYDLFASSTKGSLKSLVNSASLLRKINFPKYMVTLSMVLSNFIIFLISLIDVVLVMIIAGAPITWNLLFVPVYLILFFIFIIGISFIMAILNTFFRDIEHVYSIFLLLLMYGCAIFYPSSIVPDNYQIIFTINPVFQFIDGIRRVVYLGMSPELNNIILCAVYSLLSIVIGVIIFEKNQNKIMTKL